MTNNVVMNLEEENVMRECIIREGLVDELMSGN